MGTTPDDNDRHRAGDLDPDPFAELAPVPLADDGPPPWDDDDVPPDTEPPRRSGPTSKGMPDTEPTKPTKPKPDPLGVPLREVLTEARAEWARRGSGEVRPVPLPPSWTRTAHALHGGLWPGCHILVGGTGAGKSQWAFEVAYNAAAVEGVPVAYVGLELDGAGLAARLAALGLGRLREAVTGRRVAAVPWSGIYLGKSDALGALEKYGAEVLARLDAAPLYLVQGGAYGWSYEEIDTLAAALRERHPTGPALLVVDFLQLVAGPKPKAGARPEELRERIGAAAYRGRMAARDHGLTVLLVSATARSFYGLFKGGGRVDGDRAEELGKGDPSRFIGTGKESGEVEYAADGVIALCRGEERPDGKPRPMWLAVAKSRTGTPDPRDSVDRRGWVCLKFDGTTFEEQDPPPPPPPKKPKKKGVMKYAHFDAHAVAAEGRRERADDDPDA